MRAAIIGGGLIGDGWAARFLLNGWDVSIYDNNSGAGGAAVERDARLKDNQNNKGESGNGREL